MTDQELRQAFQARVAAAGRDDGDGWGADVDWERIVAAVVGESDPDEVARVVDRTLQDPAWAAAWQEARRLTALRDAPPPLALVEPLDEADQDTPDAPQPLASRNRPSWWVGVPLVAAAAAVAALLPNSAPSPSSTPSPPVFRDGSSATIQAEPALATEGGLVLRWSPLPPGTHVTVHVTDASLQPIHRDAGLDLAESTIPTQLYADHEGPLLWRIEAVTPAGQHQRSPTFRAALPK